MGRIIYLISILDKINKASFILVALLTAVLIFGIVFYFDKTGTRLDSEEKVLVRFLKVIGVFLGISLVGLVLIPNKEEMYMIALTKDYEVEDVYSMTKDEIKGNIDYVFKKIEELKK